jgi:hypothetical protein
MEVENEMGLARLIHATIAAYEIKGDFPALLNVVGDPWEQICFAQGTVMVCHFLAELAQIPGLVVTRRAVA